MQVKIELTAAAEAAILARIAKEHPTDAAGDLIECVECYVKHWVNAQLRPTLAAYSLEGRPNPEDMARQARAAGQQAADQWDSANLAKVECPKQAEPVQ